MFLMRVQIDNIRSVEHLELATANDAGPRQWTLLLGENGTGKSTVLKAIALAMAGSDALAELVGDANDWIRKGKNTGRIRVDLITAEGEARTAELVLRRGTKLGLFEDNRQTLSDLDAAIAHAPRHYLTTGYGVSRRPDLGERRSIRSRGRLRSPRARGVASLFFADDALTPLEIWAMDLDYRRKDGFRIARRIINTLLPEIELVRIDREQRELIFKTPDGNLPYRLLSDGYQNAAGWIGDLLAQLTDTFYDYKDPLSARGLLLIDEVDLHLHPVWQRELRRFLTSTLKNFQVICTTHSPLTAHQTDEGELYFLHREASGPAMLTAYEGAANKLMLHQLMASPMFGFETVDSDDVERIKQRYRELRDRKNRSREESALLRDLARQLEDLPSWSGASPAQARLANTLEEIERAISR